MTDTRLTQTAVEQWVPASTTVTTRVVATQVAVEQWASVAAAAPPSTQQAVVMVMA